MPFFKDDRSVVYAKPLVDGRMALGLFNYGDTPLDMTISPSDFGIRGEQTIRDLWRQKDVWKDEAKKKFTANVPAHGVVMVKIYPGNNREEEPDGKIY